MFVEMAMKLKNGELDHGSSRKRKRADDDSQIGEREGVGFSESDVTGDSGSCGGGKQTGETTNDSNDNAESWQHIDHASYTLTIKHNSLMDMYEEWHGLGNYFDKYGGAAGREVLFSGKNKSKWRKHLDNNLFSRTRRLVEAIVSYADNNNLSHIQACQQLECHYQESKRSVSKTVSKLQDLGLLQKRKDRGRRMKGAKQQHGEQRQQ